MPLPPQPPNQIPPDRSPYALRHGVEDVDYMELEADPEDFTVTIGEDGVEYIGESDDRQESTPPDEGFYDNLAKVLPTHIRQKIVTDLLRQIEEDKQARTLRDKQYEEGIRRTGLGNDAPGGADFEGASKVVHPMMTEACVDYSARVTKELYPATGDIVRPRIIGTPTKEKTEKAARKTDHMNWQIRTQIKEARSVLETTMTQVPLGGSQFIRQWWDHRLKRPRWEFAPVDRVLVPFGAADFASATRKTFIDHVSAIEFQQRIRQGQYIKVDVGSAPQMPETTKSEQANFKVEGVEDPGQNLDGNRDIYEIAVWLEVTEEAADAIGGPEQAGDLCPYLISIDESSQAMLAMYRDWEDGDEATEPIEHMFEFPFLPWRGPYSIGFPHVIGGLSAAATGALRALLDAAHTNNAVTGFIRKGSGVGGQNVRATLGTLVEIDTGTEAADLRQSIMMAPFNPPSPVLFQLLGFLTAAAKDVVRTTMDDNAATQGNTPTPVGTQMSRVEEGMVVFSSVHARAHAALDRLLAGLHRLNRLYLPDEIRVEADGKELLVRRVDYDGPCDIQPVSEPTIYSDLQRFQQINYMQQRMLVLPQLYSPYKVELAGLKLMRVPEPEGFLVQPPEPKEMNAAAENMAMALGQPVAVFAGQDHLAHLQVLMDFMREPSLGANPTLAPVYMPAAMHHAIEHMAHFYVAHCEQKATLAARVKSIAELVSDRTDVKVEFDRLMAQVSIEAVPEIVQAFSKVLPVLLQAQQLMKSILPKPPMDPTLGAVQAAMAETQRKTAADQAGHQIGTAELASKTQLQQQANAIKQQQVDQDGKIADLDSATKVRTTEMNNDSAQNIATEKIESGQTSGFSDGASLRGS